MNTSSPPTLSHIGQHHFAGALPTRDAKGRLQADLRAFPHGMKWLGEQIHSLGLLFGLYSCASQPTCARRQGSLYSEAIDAASFASWGVDYVKYDKCGESSLGIVAYSAMRDALNATGRMIFFDAASVFTLSPDPEIPFVGNSFGTWSDIKSEWHHLMRNIDNNDRWALLARPGYFNDPDMLEVGTHEEKKPGLSATEERAHFALWSVVKAPLLVGADLLALSREQLELLTHPGLLAINQDSLGVQARKRLTFQRQGVTAVAVESCALEPNGRNVSQRWAVAPLSGDATLSHIRSFDGRCLDVDSSGLVVVAPCTPIANQSWRFSRGTPTVSAIVDSAGGTAVCLNQSDWSTVSLVAHETEPPCINATTCSTNVQQEAPQRWYYEPSRHGRIVAANWANSYQNGGPGAHERGQGKGVPFSGTAGDYGRRCLAFDMDGPLQVWSGPLSGGDTIVLLLNRLDDSSAEFGATWEQLGLPSGSTELVDVMENRSSVSSVGVVAAVGAHDVRVFRVLGSKNMV